MPALRRRGAGAIVVALVAGLALASGCGVKNSPTTGTGDVSGLRLAAFASDRGKPTGQYDIYLWDFDSLAFHALPGLNYTSAERHPSITSDGRFIAFQTSLGGGAGDDVEIYDRKAQAYVNLPGLNTLNDENEPAFTGDGKMLCYTQTTLATGIRRVRLYDGATKLPVALAGLDASGATYSDYAPSPNFDGSLIAFVSTRNGNPDIFLYDRGRHIVLDGPNLRAALVSANDDLDPKFSASGRFLTFASNRATSLGLHDVFLLEFAVSASGTDTLLRDVSLANSASDELHPSVSDNGNVIVFQSNRSGQGGWDLWNFDRTTTLTTQPGTGYVSAGNDIEPALKWPY
jgi:Tol biopolymer transport system component